MTSKFMVAKFGVKKLQTLFYGTAKPFDILNHLGVTQE